MGYNGVMKFALLCGAALLIGCGGKGGGDGQKSLSELSGDWEGAYFQISIDQAGNVTGTTQAPAQPGGTVNATMTEGHAVSGGWTVPPNAPETYTGEWSYSDGVLTWNVLAGQTSVEVAFERQ